jgi:hypothetical protein
MVGTKGDSNFISQIIIKFLHGATADINVEQSVTTHSKFSNADSNFLNSTSDPGNQL